MKYDRDSALQTRINTHLSRITGIEKDYYQGLSISDIFELKTVLADINNTLTYKTTMYAAEWLIDFFQLDKVYSKKLLELIKTTKPNSNGFDINIINKNLKVVAEVKCINPINLGHKFGSAQKNSIISDFQKLNNGKKKRSGDSIIDNTKDFYKILFFLDNDHRVSTAIHDLVKRTDFKIKILSTESFCMMDKEHIYIKILSEI